MPSKQNSKRDKKKRCRCSPNCNKKLGLRQRQRHYQKAKATVDSESLSTASSSTGSSKGSDISSPSDEDMEHQDDRVSMGYRSDSHVDIDMDVNGTPSNSSREPSLSPPAEGGDEPSDSGMCLQSWQGMHLKPHT